MTKGFPICIFSRNPLAHLWGSLVYEDPKKLVGCCTRCFKQLTLEFKDAP